MARGTGTTTKQMLDAPQGAIFVWCNGHLDYPIRLSRKHGRDDLKIVPPSWLSSERWLGQEFSGVIIDHAACLSAAEWYGLDGVRTRIRTFNTDFCDTAPH